MASWSCAATVVATAASAGVFPTTRPPSLRTAGAGPAAAQRRIRAAGICVSRQRAGQGHSFAGRASLRQAAGAKLTGTLTLHDSEDALTFEATSRPKSPRQATARTFSNRSTLGLSVGLSPGFRFPPNARVKDAEKVTQEPNDGSLDAQGNPRRGAIIRTVLAALLYELSVVTRPAYTEATVEPDDGNDKENKKDESQDQRSWELRSSPPPIGAACILFAAGDFNGDDN